MANVTQTVVVGVLSFFNFVSISKKNTYAFPLTPAEIIGDVRTNRLCAANVTLAFVTHQYIGC
jgi:hypothetical protein